MKTLLIILFVMISCLCFAFNANTDMVRVRGGEFQMGNVKNDTEGDSDEKPVHTVAFTYDFWIGKGEVIFDDYDEYCTATGISKPADSGWGRGRRPVINVSWMNAIGYCNWLSEKEGLTAAYNSSGNLLDGTGTVTTDLTKVEGYRLPTEAEWEYAARGGQNSRVYKYAGSARLDEVGWYWQNSGDKWLMGADTDWNMEKAKTNNGKTHETGQKSGNELGLYDMSGNVWEWCYDWLGNYPPSRQENPTGPANGVLRIARGGSWDFDMRNCRVAIRGVCSASDSGPNLGFRVTRTIF